MSRREPDPFGRFFYWFVVVLVWGWVLMIAVQFFLFGGG